METYTGIERRRSPRVNDGIKAKITGRFFKKRIPVINISQHGALLRVHTISHLGTFVSLSLYLPEEAKPLTVKARVVRVVTICSSWGIRKFDVGVEFLNIVEEQQKELGDTINYLLEKGKEA